MTIKAIVNVEVDASPEQLAGAFSNMNDEEQARFLNECGRLFDEFNSPIYGSMSGKAQINYMVSADLLNDAGFRFVEDIAMLSRYESLKMPWPEVREAFAKRIIEEIMEKHNEHWL